MEKTSRLCSDKRALAVATAMQKHLQYGGHYNRPSHMNETTSLTYAAEDSPLARQFLASLDPILSFEEPNNRVTLVGAATHLNG